MRRIGALSLLLALLAGVGCAGGMEDVNRVQPNYYDKALFSGTWYMRQTFVDVPYEAFFAFEGLGGKLAKVRWEIQEKFLFAYDISETIPGANGPSAGTPSYKPVAAWPIISHFDIVREYNPSTGEQSNVIVENTSDRPWYERRYIRVDWSSSRTMGEYTIDNYITKIMMSGANHWIQPHEETDPDAAEVGPDYISIVNAFDAYIPPDVCAYYFADNPIYLYYDNWTGVEGCGPALVRMRTSFAKVDDERVAGYEPFNYLDRKPLLGPGDMNGDGKLDDEDTLDKVLRICSDVKPHPDGGLSCTKWSYVTCTDSMLQALNDDPFYSQFEYTKEDCETPLEDYFSKFGYFRTNKILYDRQYGQVEAGRRYYINRHHIWKRSVDRDGNPIPFAQREVRPIVYYLNADFPEDLYDAAEEIGRQWDAIFRETVAILQNKSMDEVGTVFEVRKNSCSPDNLRAYVSKRPEAQKIADRVIGGMKNLRKDNIKNLCAALQHNLGFQWQKIGDVRYNFIYWVDKPTTAGLLGYGPSYPDPDTGEIVSAAAYVYGAALDRSAAQATDVVMLMSGKMDPDDFLLGRQLREAVLNTARRKAEERNRRPSESFFREFDRRMAAFKGQPIDRVTSTITPDHYDAKLERLKAMGIDKQFLDVGTLALLRPQLAAAGDPSLFEKAREEVSFFDLLSPKRIEQREEVSRLKGEHYCMYDLTMADRSIIGLALEFDAEGLERDEIYRRLREKMFIGVMLHEVGHTLGLRHNFAASMDALNYFDEFWEYFYLDEDPATARTQASQEVAQRLDRCIDRANELGIPTPTTLDCLRASELKQASIMDYGAKFNAEFMGLGKYDRAAIAFGYGNLVEVFEEDVNRHLPFPPSTTSYFTHYKNLPDAYGGDAQNFLKRKLVRYDELQRKQSEWAMTRLRDGLPRLSMEGCISNCDPTPVQVPYRFCIDEFRGRTLDCYTWDEGASLEEIIDATISDYDVYYFVHGFRRGRANWSPGLHFALNFNGLFRGTRAFQYYYFYNTLYSEYGLDLVRDLQIASVKTLNQIAKIMQMPAPEMYCEHADGVFKPTENPEDDCVPGGTRFTVPLGVGRPQWLIWNDDYEYQIESFGTYWERIDALIALTWNQSLFLQEVGDPRLFVIGFNKAFEEEVLELMGAVALGEVGRYGGALEGLDTGEIRVVHRPLVDLETFGLADPPVDTRPTIAPPFSFEGREIALLIGSIFLNSTEDAMTEFRNYFNVVLKGSDEDFDLPSWVDPDNPEHYLEFQSPYSGAVYRTFANPRSPHLSFGMRAVRDAKEYHDTVWLPTYADLEAARDAWLNASPAEKESRYAAYLAADEAMRKVDIEMNTRIELLDRIRFWYSVTKLGM